MSSYGTPSGLFRLSESDKHVGSFIQRVDVESLLDKEFAEYKDAILSCVAFQNDGSVNEACVACCWEETVPATIRNRRSFDEIILDCLIRSAYPTAAIERQVPFGTNRGNRPQVDFIVAVNGQKKAIEFYGPGHFVGRYAKPPSARQEQVKTALGIDCVVWPFWIQRCERNVKAIFDQTLQGLGALWSCSKSCLFRKFPLDTPGNIVQQLNEQFRAARNGSIGYFYEKDSEGRVKPEHFILDRIRKGSCPKDILIPQGINPVDHWKWLPEEFRRSNCQRG
jgi:hypothetical protein